MTKVKNLHQITIGELIKILKSLPPETSVPELEFPHSYRGYYDHLAFEFYNKTTTAKDLLELCKSCLHNWFEGYKGGEFSMTEYTPLWISQYGTIGSALVDFNVKDQEIILVSEAY